MTDTNRSKSPGWIPSPGWGPLWSLLLMIMVFLGACSSGQDTFFGDTQTTHPSMNAQLRSLKPSTGSLSPAFDSTVTAYVDTVPFTTEIFFLTPTVSDSHATVKVNSEVVTSGSASANVLLDVGANSVPVVVTAQDTAVSKVYTVNVFRIAPAKNAALKSLAVSAGSLAPLFDTARLAYSDTVSNATTEIGLTPVVADTNARIKVNGTTLASGSISSSIPLQVGSNAITVLVTAQDTSVKRTYTLNITRAKSSNANLSALAISPGTLSPAFSAASTAYSTSVDYATTSLAIDAAASEANATLKINGTVVTSRTATVPLHVGVNTVAVEITAQDGTIKTYTLSVTRAGSPDATLAGLTLSSGSLDQAFDATTTAYTANVGNATTSITVTPTVNEANATVKINGAAVTSGSASAPIALSVGSNNIEILVTAQDGTTKTYTVSVTRAASSDATLSALALSSGTLSPTFDAATTTYSATVANATTSLTVTPTVNQANATVKINGTAVTSGSASAPIALSVGANTITVLVTAQDGTTKTYTVSVTRAASSDATLSALALSSGTLSPTFDAATTTYSATVANATTSLTVTPTVSQANATVKVNATAVTSGSASASIALSVGANTITVTVTAQDGTTKTYTTTVTRAASSDATLSGLALSSGTLSPAFDAATASYSTSVANATTSLTVTPTVNQANATVKVNTTAVTSGSASGAITLATGSNTITVLVTAQDGTTKTYTISVTRAAASVSDPTVVYHLNNSLEEASGSGVDAVHVGSTSLFTSSGKSGYGITGPTSSNFIYLPGGKYDLSGDYATAMWVKTTSTSAGWLMSKQGNTLSGSSAHGGDYEVKSWIQANGTVKVELGSNTAWAYTDVTSTATVNDGNWHFICTVVSGSTLKVYVDDKTAITNTIGSQGRISNTTSAIVLGGYAGNLSSAPTSITDSEKFIGAMDEVYLFDGALTDSEVLTLYNNTK